LVFDDGAFDENETFLLTDWLARTPKHILAKNFNVPESAFDHIPDHELYIFLTQVPPKHVSQDIVPGNGLTPAWFSFPLLSQEAIRTKGGSVRIVDSHNFAASKSIAAALNEVHPGGLRELHWHANADEWQYYLSGKARMTVFVAGKAAT